MKSMAMAIFTKGKSNMKAISWKTIRMAWAYNCMRTGTTTMDNGYTIKSMAKDVISVKQRIKCMKVIGTRVKNMARVT